jgi:hypothetical protein
MSKILKIIIWLVIAIVVIFAVGYFYYLYAGQSYSPVSWKTYKNAQYGFQLTFPESWKGYAVDETTWQGNAVDNFNQKYSGPESVFKNPQTTPQQPWQDIPIMVFTPEQWQLVLQERLAVSAAPIGPAEVGQNTKYIFATPPRWYGFTNAIGFQEAVEIVKTFKAF